MFRYLDASDWIYRPTRLWTDLFVSSRNVECVLCFWSGRNYKRRKGSKRTRHGLSWPGVRANWLLPQREMSAGICPAKQMVRPSSWFKKAAVPGTCGGHTSHGATPCAGRCLVPSNLRIQGTSAPRGRHCGVSCVVRCSLRCGAFPGQYHATKCLVPRSVSGSRKARGPCSAAGITRNKKGMRRIN